MTAGAGEYRGDVDNPSYDGWSYLGDRYRCPLADDELSRHHRRTGCWPKVARTSCGP
jgi:hypothetical protein